MCLYFAERDPALLLCDQVPVGVTAAGAAGEIANANHVFQPDGRFAASNSPYALKFRYPCTSPTGKRYLGTDPGTRDLKHQGSDARRYRLKFVISVSYHPSEDRFRERLCCAPIDRDAVRRGFFGIMLVRPHAESAAGYPDHAAVLRGGINGNVDLDRGCRKKRRHFERCLPIDCQKGSSDGSTLREEAFQRILDRPI